MEIRDSLGQLIVADKAWNTWPAVIFLSVVAALTAFVLVRARDERWYGALFIAGIACYLLFRPTRTAVFDTTAQELRLENRWIVLRQRRTIPFHEIAAIGIETKSWSNQHTPSYRIRARLASGHIVVLTNWSGRTGGLPSGASWSKHDDSSLYDPELNKYRAAADRIREVVGGG
jgi:hypothetical protein